MNRDPEVEALEGVRERLQARFPTQPAENVKLAVSLSYQGFTDARVRDFIPVLVEHEARERLARLA